MRTVLTAAFLAIIAGQVYAQIPTGTIIIYRQRGANFGLLHYAQGEHPTIYCDEAKVAKLAERRKTTVSAVTGPHLCVANEKQYPGELNADSESISVNVKPGRTKYLRLESHFGHVHFVFSGWSLISGTSISFCVRCHRKLAQPKQTRCSQSKIKIPIQLFLLLTKKNQSPSNFRSSLPPTIYFVFAKNRSMKPVSKFPARNSGSARIRRWSGIVV